MLFYLDHCQIVFKKGSRVETTFAFCNDSSSAAFVQLRPNTFTMLTQDDVDLNKDEVNILQGALVLQTKKVVDVMTPLSDAFLLPLQTVLDFDSISDIKTQGYSRIPVYDRERENIVHILLAKDLLFIDPDDKKPLEEICNFYNKPFIRAEKDKPLNQMLNEFKTGEKGHLAIVKSSEAGLAFVLSSYTGFVLL